MHFSAARYGFGGSSRTLIASNSPSRAVFDSTVTRRLEIGRLDIF